MTQFIAEVMVESDQVNVSYTGCFKAFDWLDHSILLRNLSSFQLTKRLIFLIYSYLTDRTSIVEYNGFKSMAIIAMFRVPQCLVSGLFFYYVFVDDICLNIKSNSLLHAHECKIHSRVNSTSECSGLQNDLKTLSKWCEKTSLPLNINKLYEIHAQA